MWKSDERGLPPYVGAMSFDKAFFGGETPPDPYPGRRQLDELTGDELRAQPAWWYPGRDQSQLVGPDEATVMPIDAGAADADGAIDFPDGKYLLHAVFTLADGTQMDGHVTFVPGDDGSIAVREPTLCTPRGQVALWVGALAASETHLAPVGKPRAAVFPLKWRATLHPASGELTGELAGFGVWRDGRVRFV